MRRGDVGCTAQREDVAVADFPGSGCRVRRGREKGNDARWETADKQAQGGSE